MFFRFLRDEKAAITVDYVVLTAAAAFIGLPVIATVSGGTEDRATDFADRQVEVWRKGENALANYTPINEQGFDMFWDAMQAMTPEELAALSAYSQYAHSNMGEWDLTEGQENFLNELESGVLISYAEDRGVRIDTDAWDFDETSAVWNTYEFDDISNVYGAGIGVSETGGS